MIALLALLACGPVDLADDTEPETISAPVAADCAGGDAETEIGTAADGYPLVLVCSSDAHTPLCRQAPADMDTETGAWLVFCGTFDTVEVRWVR